MTYFKYCGKNDRTWKEGGSDFGGTWPMTSLPRSVKLVSRDRLRLHSLFDGCYTHKGNPPAENPKFQRYHTHRRGGFTPVSTFLSNSRLSSRTTLLWFVTTVTEEMTHLKEIRGVLHFTSPNVVGRNQWGYKVRRRLYR